MTVNRIDIGPMLDPHIGPYTIGFITLNPDDPRPLGSGTLVKYRFTQGILTCGHVLIELRKHLEIGISLFPARTESFQQFTIPLKESIDAAVSFYNGSPSADGPDLAYLPLPVKPMASLGASASILDLELHEKRAKAAAPSEASSFYVVAGVVEELTPPATRHDRKLLLNVEGLVNVGRVTGKRCYKNFDLLEFEPVPGAGFKIPSTYGATSGGGMWKVYVGENGGGAYKLECQFSGVVFWETQPPSQKLIGHGPISIYDRLLSTIARGPSKSY